jgi:hypothetical protein
MAPTAVMMVMSTPVGRHRNVRVPESSTVYA